MSSNRLIYDVEAFTDNKATNDKIHSAVMDDTRNQNEKGCSKNVSLVDLVSLESKLFAIDKENLPCEPDRTKGYNTPIDEKYKYYNYTGCNITFGHLQFCPPDKAKVPETNEKK